MDYAVYITPCKWIYSRPYSNITLAPLDACFSVSKQYN